MYGADSPFPYSASQLPTSRTRKPAKPGTSTLSTDLQRFSMKHSSHKSGKDCKSSRPPQTPKPWVRPPLLQRDWADSEGHRHRVPSFLSALSVASVFPPHPPSSSTLLLGGVLSCWERSMPGRSWEPGSQCGVGVTHTAQLPCSPKDPSGGWRSRG